MYAGKPVYTNPAVLARRTATGTGDWVAEPGMCPQTEALVARNVILPIGVRYTEQDCDEIAAAIVKVAGEVL
jgi:dTDP-4-amino-4,6-dideoxygalactose transaminase